MAYYKNNPDRVRPPAEQIVIDLGFDWVTTNRLGPGGQLRIHLHHSHNTHYIVEGSLMIGEVDGPQHEHWHANAFAGPGTLIDMPPGVTYRAVAGRHGCTFVEGHKLLSPTTAERFQNNRTFLPAEESEAGAFTTQIQQTTAWWTWAIWACVIVVVLALILALM